MFTLQDTANAPPQMLLDNPEYTIHMSSLLEKALQNGPKAHVPKKSLERDTHQAAPLPGDVRYLMGSTASNRSGTLLECYNLPQKNDAPHWVPIVTQGCFLGQ